MPRESVHSKLARVRKPRVHITYDVDVGGAIEQKELPFVVGVLADLSGNPKDALPRVKDRKFVEIDRDNFNQVLAGTKPRLTFKVPNRLSDDGSSLGVELEFRDMDDFGPEAVALKRQCVIHGKPFISTVASARDWIENERIHAGLAPDPRADRLHAFESQTLALIAHDAMKPQMLAFAAEHYDVLSRFQRRVATGTTGQRLNEMAWSRGWPQDTPWVHRYLSGPMGGDAQIADLVLERRCQRAVFFEDPHVARQHEADIQLLERAVTTVTDEAVCITSPAVAARWVAAVRRRAQPRAA